MRNPLADRVSTAFGVGKLTRDWFRVHYGQLRGGVIEAVRLDVRGNGQGGTHVYAWPVLVVRMEDGRRLLVRVTARGWGNAPGYLEIEPLAGRKEERR